jgi:protein-disulfide isomerase
MFKTILKCLTLLLLAAAIFGCGSKPPTKEVVAESVKKLIPVAFEVVDVSPLKPIAGLFQVVVTVGKQPVVFYMDKDGKYIVSGSVVELQTKKNLTAETLSKFSGEQKGSPGYNGAPAPKAR